MKKLFLFAIVLMMSAVNAFAVSLEFAFDVNSSGPSIYACDAGVKHRKHTDRVCYDRTTSAACSVSLCPSVGECNCVCTGGASNGDGEYRQDFLKATYADWTENGSYVPAGSVTASVSAQEASFARIFTGTDEFDKQLTNLSFNLGSERYGAEFYLDVCYRGPQIEYFQSYGTQTNSDSNFFPNFAIKLQATVTDLVSANGLKYSQLADLQIKSEVTCDVQGVGTYIYAHSGTDATTNPTYDNALAHTIVGVSGGDKNFSTNYVAFNAGANVSLLNDWINLGNAETPRFCKVRYTFIENARENLASPMAQVRKWKQHKARICTYTEISEGEASN